MFFLILATRKLKKHKNFINLKNKSPFCKIFPEKKNHCTGVVGVPPHPTLTSGLLHNSTRLACGTNWELATSGPWPNCHYWNFGQDGCKRPFKCSCHAGVWLYFRGDISIHFHYFDQQFDWEKLWVNDVTWKSTLRKPNLERQNIC